MVILSELSILFGLSITGNLLYLSFPLARNIIQRRAEEELLSLKSDPLIKIIDNPIFENMRDYRLLNGIITGERPKERGLHEIPWVKQYFETYNSRMDIFLASAITGICVILTVLGVYDKLGWTPGFATRAFSDTYFHILAFGVAVFFMIIPITLIIKRAYIVRNAISYIDRVAPQLIRIYLSLIHI